MDSLALQVEPIAGECATSHAARLAERNGEPRLRRFFTHMSLPIKELHLVKVDACCDYQSSHGIIAKRGKIG